MGADRSEHDGLDRATCLELLRSVHIGRVALSHRALPVIVPVRFTVDGDDVVFAVALGGTIDRASRGAVVAFEAEGPAGCVEPAWSVMVTGVARVGDRALVADATRGRMRTVAITTTRITGRRALVI